MRPSFAVPAAFFLSGAAGLIFQVVWLYRAGLVLGSSLAAITVVLSGFMAGLACGNALAAKMGDAVKRPLRVYAGLELVVAAGGVLVTYFLPHVGSVVASLASNRDAGMLVHVARLVIAFVMLAAPATAMGATLPILVAMLYRDTGRFGSALGRLYGWNTLGAVAGVVIAEVLLIGVVGVNGSAWVAGGLNLSAAVIALLVRLNVGPATSGARTIDAAAPTTRRARQSRASNAAEESRFSRTSIIALLGATTLAGATLLALEVIWFRFLSMYVLVTTTAMGLMLAVVLAGIGLGGLAASMWLAEQEHRVVYLPAVACACGVAVILPYAAFGLLTTGTQVGAWYRMLWFAIELTLPASFASGILFTMTGDALQRVRQSPSASTGWLVLANTAGAIAGPPLAAYVLLPLAGMERSLFILGLTYAFVAALALAGVRPEWAAHVQAPRRIRLSSAGSVAALALALALFPFGAMDAGYFQRAARAYADDGSTIVAKREGPAETLFVMQQRWLQRPVYSRLVTNGFSMSGTALQGQRYMRAFAYYPMLLHDGPLRKALVVCYGVGVTVGAVTHIPSVESIDVAEISRDTVAMSEVIYPAGTRPLEDPRVRLHIEDGRFFLQSTPERFDLITGEPPPPRTPGTVNIYTREYFSLVRSRLNEGGLATYWVPVARPNPGTDVNTIIRAFCDVFEDCSLWNATPFDLMLIGSRGASGPRTLDEFSAPWQTPKLEARLREVGFERPEQIGATFVADAVILHQLTSTTPPLTDDFPQRLRPVAGRPSLSDPAYGIDAAATQMYHSAIDPVLARKAFQSSPAIRRLWPGALIERTLPFFDQQALVNRVYWEGARPLGRIEDLDAVLSETTLRTLPLWMLGSDEVKQGIAESAPADVDGQVSYARALRALSGRDYAGAARFLDATQQHGMKASTVRPLMAYALLKSGRPDLAVQLAAAAQPATDDERHFWQWVRSEPGT